MKIQELLEYIEMSRRLADEILCFDPDHQGAREVGRLLSSSQASLKTALSDAAKALNEASTLFDQYNFKVGEDGDNEPGAVVSQRRLSEVPG